MAIGRPVPKIVLTSVEQQKLELIARRPKSNQRDARRARIVLQCAQGLSNSQIARREGVCLPTAGKWRTRFARNGIGALGDAPRSISDAKVEEVVTKTLESTPRGADPFGAAAPWRGRPAFRSTRCCASGTPSA